MSLLLREIKHISSSAADVLKKADLCTDSDIRSLTREDLQELFPGLENLKLRRAIFEKVHNQKPVEQLLKKMEEFLPPALTAALTNNDVLADYLHILKDVKSQIDNVQSFLDAQISFLEETGTKQPDKNSATCGPGPVDGQGTIASGASNQLVLQTDKYGRPQQRPPTTLMYQIVVSGKTFDAHLQLMEKVKTELQDQFQLIENKHEPVITFLFCPITSRVASDVDAAMMDVKDDKPIILVLMHHTHWAKFMPLITWPQYPKVVLSVNVFYHETVSGLLKCDENNTAIIEIQKQILGRFYHRSDFVRQNVQSIGKSIPNLWKYWK